MKFIVSFAFVIAITGCVSTQQNTKQAKTVANDTYEMFVDVFEGNWVGELQPIGGNAAPFKAVEWNAKVRIRILQGKAEVFFQNDDEWSPIYPTRFELNIKGPNAVIFMQSIASDLLDKTGFGGWSESRVLLLTKKDDKTLYISMQRAVNNFLKKHEEENSRFFNLFVGELKRVDSISL
jgi:hypothetical protein